MRVTRRGWRVLGIAAVLAGVGVLAADPVYLGGAAAVATLFLARQLQVVLAVRDLGLAVEMSHDPTRVLVEDDVTETVTVTRETATALALDVECRTPVAATRHGDRTATLEDGERRATVEATLTVAVAGPVTVPPPRVTARDRLGLVTHTFTADSATELTVEPRRPRNIHVGQGGERFVTAYGDHPADAEGAGLDPAELREYVAGDPASRIDWAATARLNEAYVREFEAETDRRLNLILDARASLGDGPDGETKLDYLREVALAYFAQSRRDRDPIGYAIVDADGIRDQALPDADPSHYEAVRHALLDAAPTDGTSRRRRGTPARGVADRLGAEDTAYATRLRPFFGATPDPTAAPPLVGAVRAAVQATRGTVWTVLLTDDAAPTELRDAVTAARRGDRQVRVLLAPSALFAPGGLSDAEAAYDRYRTFESLRRDLDGLARVHAYEVGPGDRLDAILAHARRATRRS